MPAWRTPLFRPEACRPSRSSFSSSTTPSAPRATSSRAMVSPTIPAPTIRMSALSLMVPSRAVALAGGPHHRSRGRRWRPRSRAGSRLPAARSARGAAAPRPAVLAPVASAGQEELLHLGPAGHGVGVAEIHGAPHVDGLEGEVAEEVLAGAAGGPDAAEQVAEHGREATVLVGGEPPPVLRRPQHQRRD